LHNFSKIFLPEFMEGHQKEMHQFQDDDGGGSSNGNGKPSYGAAGVLLVATHRQHGDVLCVFRHPQRGWELPWGRNDGPPKHRDAIDTARDELFEETSGLVYCPRSVLESAPVCHPGSDKPMYGLCVQGMFYYGAKGLRDRFRSNRQALLDQRERAWASGQRCSGLGCMLEMRDAAFIPLDGLERADLGAACRRHSTHHCKHCSTVTDVWGKPRRLSAILKWGLRGGGLGVARQAAQRNLSRPIHRVYDGADAIVPRFPWGADSAPTCAPLTGVTTLCVAELLSSCASAAPPRVSALVPTARPGRAGTFGAGGSWSAAPHHVVGPALVAARVQAVVATPAAASFPPAARCPRCQQPCVLRAGPPVPCSDCLHYLVASGGALFGAHYSS
jgi:hypothetical protein